MIYRRDIGVYTGVIYERILASYKGVYRRCICSYTSIVYGRRGVDMQKMHHGGANLAKTGFPNFGRWNDDMGSITLGGYYEENI